jgi:hypothetical protein
MLPLRSRTSWRLRALTVTCLPRDWTWAGIYHFAHNRRRGHDLPEGHHGELAEQVWAIRTPAGPGPGGSPGRGRVIRTLGSFRPGRTRTVPWASLATPGRVFTALGVAQSSPDGQYEAS